MMHKLYEFDVFSNDVIAELTFSQTKGKESKQSLSLFIRNVSMLLSSRRLRNEIQLCQGTNFHSRTELSY
jgi:hypothetical protein